MTRTTKIHLRVLAVEFLLTLAPVLSVLIAMLATSGSGCEVNEGSANLCIVAGFDFAPALSSMFAFGWLALVTLPFGGLIITIHLVVWLVRTLRSKKASAQVSQARA